MQYSTKINFTKIWNYPIISVSLTRWRSRSVAYHILRLRVQYGGSQTKQLITLGHSLKVVVQISPSIAFPSKKRVLFIACLARHFSSQHAYCYYTYNLIPYSRTALYSSTRWLRAARGPRRMCILIKCKSFTGIPMVMIRAFHYCRLPP